MVDKLIARLNTISPLSEALSERIKSIAKISSHRKGDIILAEGQVCSKACLIVKGLVRFYYINEGKDITSRLMAEGDIISSWLSYYTQKPSNEFIAAIEDTELVCMEYSSIQKLFAELPESNIIGRKETEHAYYLSELRTQMLRKHTAEEKYKYFLDNHPQLMTRVPLKHIASYLGMNEETLSRVRSRYHRRK
ncbi:MAG: Crp/Fnr family transcriptional regulator [Bacteroidetes bacterium]|jgi:CRP-like cAMP-binding protein|nr:MAG: Crp/Fnr family transcriptional regulator [Bacteroidota bacterium]